jgi:hypothetical protein
MNNNLKLFFSAMLQIFLVSCNTYLVANGFMISAGIVGFSLSWVWAWNIKRIAISSNTERLVYCLGAGIGTAFGVAFMTNIKKYFN